MPMKDRHTHTHTFLQRCQNVSLPSETFKKKKIKLETVMLKMSRGLLVSQLEWIKNTAHQKLHRTAQNNSFSKWTSLLEVKIVCIDSLCHNWLSASGQSYRTRIPFCLVRVQTHERTGLGCISQANFDSEFLWQLVLAFCSQTIYAHHKRGLIAPVGVTLL